MTQALGRFVLVAWLAVPVHGAEPVFRVRDSVPGLDYRNVSGLPDQLPILDQNGQGLALIDYDNDGLVDLYVCNGSTAERHRAGRNPGNRLYRNLGNWRFEDVTERAGVRCGAWSVGAGVADYDADGDFDLLVTNWGPNTLYRNNSDGTFTDVTERTGLAGAPDRYSSSAAFADFDGDGRLDVYVSNYVYFDPGAVPTTDTDGGPPLYRGVVTGPGPWRYAGQRDALYLQRSGGAFEDVSERAGLGATEGYRGFGVVATDLDGDGDVDVYVGCDVMPNLFLENTGAAKFRTAGPDCGATLGKGGVDESGMGVAAADFDDDGDLDLFTINFAGQKNTFYRNLGHGRFEDHSSVIGFNKHPAELGWSVICADFNNDGWRDVLVANGHIYPQVEQLGDPLDTYRQTPRLYLGNREHTLKEASTIEAFGRELQISLRGAAAGDMDNDSDLDIVAVQHNGPLLVLENLASRPGYLFDLRGAKGGRSPIGARVLAKTNRRTIYAPLLANQGFQSTQDPRVFVTVCPDEVLRSVIVEWPGGTRQQLARPPDTIVTRIECAGSGPR